MMLQKKNFNEIYNYPSPKPYIDILGQLSYRQPDFVYEPLQRQVKKIIQDKGRCQIVDVACSYGFNGGIVKYDLPYGEYFNAGNSQISNLCYVIGIDISKNALIYALKNHYIDDMICRNLERDEFSTDNYELIKKTDLVVASGAFSYVGLSTFKKIYESSENKADFIGWPACSYDKTELLEFLKSIFYKVYIHPTPFPMRKFACQQEKESFILAMKNYNPEFCGQFEERLCVFQISASGRKP